MDMDRTITAVVQGDRDAWSALIRELGPGLRAMAARHRSMRGKGQATDDDVSEVVTATLERLRRDDFRNLRLYLGQVEALGPGAAQGFESWVYGALDYAVRDYLRSRHGRAPRRSHSATRLMLSKRDLGTLAGRFPTGQEPALPHALQGVTTRLTLAQIAEVVGQEFSGQERQAFELYYGKDAGFERIAGKLGLENAKAAERLIRRLNARLRHRFVRPGE